MRVQHEPNGLLRNLADGRDNFRRERRELIVHHKYAVGTGRKLNITATPHQHMDALSKIGSCDLNVFHPLGLNTGCREQNGEPCRRTDYCFPHLSGSLYIRYTLQYARS